MAGKITELTAAGTLDFDELIEIVDNPSTSPVSRRAALSAIRAGLVTQATFDAQGPSGRELAVAESTVAQQNITAVTDLTGLSISFTVASRPVYVEVLLPWVNISSAAATGSASIADASNNPIRYTAFGESIQGYTFGVQIWERISTPGSYTRKVRIQRTGSTGVIANNFDLATIVSTIRAIER